MTIKLKNELKIKISNELKEWFNEKFIEHIMNNENELEEYYYDGIQIG